MKARRGDKSPDMIFTISEVAAELDVPQDVVRFWGSKFFQVLPLKRGWARPYYRLKDVMLLHLIRDLLYFEGCTVRGVQHALREIREKTVIEPERRPSEEKCEIIQWNGGSHGSTAPADGVPDLPNAGETAEQD